MNDQYGRPVFVGDTVTIKGSLIDLLDDPDYINCTVLLDQQMPPSGTQVRIDLNTQQVVKEGPGEPPPMPQPPPASRLTGQREARQALIAQIRLDLAHTKRMLQQLMPQGQPQQIFGY